MAKVVKQKYTKSDGSKAIYSYLVPVPKFLMETSGINVDKEIKIEIQKGKLIISN
jgi:hypothetical protein